MYTFLSRVFLFVWGGGANRFVPFYSFSLFLKSPPLSLRLLYDVFAWKSHSSQKCENVELPYIYFGDGWVEAPWWRWWPWQAQQQHLLLLEGLDPSGLRCSRLPSDEPNRDGIKDRVIFSDRPIGVCRKNLPEWWDADDQLPELTKIADGRTVWTIHRSIHWYTERPNVEKLTERKLLSGWPNIWPTELTDRINKNHRQNNRPNNSAINSSARCI